MPLRQRQEGEEVLPPTASALSGLPPVVRTQALVAGILGHWPTVEPPRPVPAAVQQRFNALAAQQTAARVQEKKDNDIAIESGMIQNGDTTCPSTSVRTLTLGQQR